MTSGKPSPIPITMKDVADRAGVALSTVSYALSGTRPVSEETRQKIFSVIEQMGYQPNLIARSLVTRRTGIIALLLPNPHERFSEIQLEFISVITSKAAEMGYGVLLWTTPLQDLNTPWASMIDGYLLMEVCQNDVRIPSLQKLGRPFVLLGRTQDPTGICYVDLDQDRFLFRVVDYLAGCGHQAIGLLNYDHFLIDSQYSPAIYMKQSFQTAVEAAGLKGWTLACNGSPQDGYERTNELLALQPETTAVMTCYPSMYTGILRALQERGKNVPDDFSIVSIALARVAEQMVPPLTTLDHPAAEMAALGIEMLIKQIRGESAEPCQKVLNTPFTIRHSSGLLHSSHKSLISSS